MLSLTQKLTEILGEAFETLGLPAALGAVQVSDRPDLAQFQCNGAMAAAKIAKKAPRAIAGDVIEALKDNIHLASVEIAGPGFININVMDEWIATHLNEIQGARHSGIPQISKKKTVVLDYGGPNIAKPMHVGHLRSSIIGDCLRRMHNYAGYKTISDVHLGDWGLPMGQVISELAIRYPDWPYFDETFTDEFPAESPVSMAELEEIYPAASKACKADENRLDAARQATVKLQDKHTGYWVLWEHFIDVSVRSMKQNFQALDIHFDLWAGESSVHHLIAPMIKAIEKKGLAVQSDGALIMPVAETDDKKEVPPLILRKGDGGVMYGTTDLATLVERMQEHKPAKIIYATDLRQSLHFEQVFRAARKADIVPETTALIHAGFGTMNGPDRKPFKTREGGVLRLDDMIAMGIEKADKRLEDVALAQDMDEDERDNIAHKVAIAAIKFADLQNNRTADYIFDFDRLTSFEGKTGPYVLYQAVRIRSLLSKAGYKPKQSSASPDFVLQEADRNLALILCSLPDHFENALKNLTPHILCDYVYKLAQEFSRFYASCHILSEENERLRASRLALCAQTSRQITLVLDMLGIQIPDRM